VAQENKDKNINNSEAHGGEGYYVTKVNSQGMVVFRVPGPKPPETSGERRYKESLTPKPGDLRNRTN
jgi:hypothetical protein